MPKLPPYEVCWADPNCFGPQQIDVNLYDLEYGEYYERLIAMLQAKFLGAPATEQTLAAMKNWVAYELTGYIGQGVLFEYPTGFWQWDLAGVDNDRRRD